MPKKSPSTSPKQLKEQSAPISADHSLTPLEQNNRQHNRASVVLKQDRKLSMPLFSIAHSLILTVQVMDAMFEGDMNLGNFTGNTEKEPEKPTLMHVLDMETSVEGFLICNAVIKSTLEKLPGGYIGKYFQFRDGGKQDGKRYRTVDITLMREE